MGGVWENRPDVAIVTWDEKKGNKWDPQDFFDYGKKEIAGVETYLREIKPYLQKGRALDFGCGIGRNSLALASYFQSVDGVDISSTMIERAEKFKGEVLNVSYHINSEPNLKLFQNDQFDFIYSNITLQHIQPKYSLTYIREFLRLLKPGGVILFQLPSHQNSLIKRLIKLIIPQSLLTLYRKATDHTFPRFEMNVIPKRKVIQYIKKAGGKILDIKKDSNAGAVYSSYQYCLAK